MDDSEPILALPATEAYPAHDNADQSDGRPVSCSDSDVSASIGEEEESDSGTDEYYEQGRRWGARRAASKSSMRKRRKRPEWTRSEVCNSCFMLSLARFMSCVCVQARCCCRRSNGIRIVVYEIVGGDARSAPLWRWKSMVSHSCPSSRQNGKRSQGKRNGCRISGIRSTGAHNKADGGATQTNIKKIVCYPCVVSFGRS